MPEKSPVVPETPPVDHGSCDLTLDYTDGFVAWSEAIFEWHDEKLIDDDTFCGAINYLDSRGLMTLVNPDQMAAP